MHGCLSARSIALAAGLALAGSFGAVAPLVASPPDPRFKADLLLIVAHPDDDVLAGSYLAKLVLDEGKHVAVVFMTSGESGGNEAGPERAASLGLIRQTEARRDLATLGITDVWFLGGRDTPGQDPRRSLAVWGHGRALGEAVRVVRLTRPDVILTWLPVQVTGENHGDHQAASVIATEAFDTAGDPAAFPEQLAAPVREFESEFDGLEAWQPGKLYFMSDAMDTAFMAGHGPSYPVTEISRSRKVPYWLLAYDQLKAHITQYRPQLEQLAALTPDQREQLFLHSDAGLINPLRLVLGKSVVGGEPTADVFAGATSDRSVPAPRRSERASEHAVLLSLGGPWHYYELFWQAHDLRELPALPLQAIGPVATGATVRIPLRLANSGPRPLTVSLTAKASQGWQVEVAAAATVPAASAVEVLSAVTVPATAAGPTEIVYEASVPGAPESTLRVPVFVRKGGGGLPQ